MTYQVLALKWRPKLFEEVVGQETVTRTLRNAIEQDRTAHAFLFSGVRGVGKTTTARILAKALNCASGPTVKPCGECPACVEIASSTSLDVLEIDGASNNGVEQVRDIIEASRYAPSRDRFKIYIIDEVHMLTTPAFNALLKTLEEPPPRVKFIFATTEYHKIPDTIVSRCQQFEFRTVPSGIIADQLRSIARREEIEISEAAVSQIARAAEGSLRDALSALDQVLAAVGTRIEEKDVAELLGLIDHEVLAAAARAIVDRQTSEILSIVDDLVRGGRDLRNFARGLIQYFRDVLVVRAAPDSPELVELAGDRTELAGLADRLSEDDLIRSIDLLTQVEGALRWAPEPRFHLEVALLKLAQLRELASFEDLLARFEALESGSGPTPRTGGGSKRSAEREAPPRRTTTRRPPASAASRPLSSSGTAKTPKESRTVPSEAMTSSPHELVERILDRIRSVNPKLSALLSHHNGVSLDGDCLHIGFDVDQEFFQEQLEREDLRQILEKTASECAGRPLRVEVALSREGDAEPTPAPAAPEDALRERVLKEPLVRSFLETFQGEIEEIKPLESASPDDQSSDRPHKR
jgi:DNA polymerase-3 subunit gamma/tau